MTQPANMTDAHSPSRLMTARLPHPQAQPLTCATRSLSRSSCRPRSSTQLLCPVGGSLSTQLAVPSLSGTQRSGSSRRAPAVGCGSWDLGGWCNTAALAAEVRAGREEEGWDSNGYILYHHVP